MEEQTFWQAIQQRDETAIRTLLATHQTRVFNLILNLVHHREEAEELCQDVFVQAIESAHGFRGDSSVATWLYRIAMNKALDHVRARNRKKRFAFITSLWNDNHELTINPATYHHPGVLLENQEDTVIFFQVLDTLPSKQKTAFVMAQLEGYSYLEISAVMKITESAVESLLVRARQHLRVALGKYFDRTAGNKKH